MGLFKRLGAFLAKRKPVTPSENKRVTPKKAYKLHRRRINRGVREKEQIVLGGRSTSTTRRKRGIYETPPIIPVTRRSRI
ncbi:MAG: hypothetical protein ACI9LM_000106 [Alteromonadaceae bacterium]|jgi:hypothetical protein